MCAGVGAGHGHQMSATKMSGQESVLRIEAHMTEVSITTCKSKNPFCVSRFPIESTSIKVLVSAAHVVGLTFFSVWTEVLRWARPSY